MGYNSMPINFPGTSFHRAMKVIMKHLGGIFLCKSLLTPTLRFDKVGFLFGFPCFDEL